MAMATKRKLPITLANNERYIEAKSRMLEKEIEAQVILDSIDAVDKAFVKAYEEDAKAFVKPELIQVDGQVFINPETKIKFSNQFHTGKGNRSLLTNCRGLDFRFSFMYPRAGGFSATILTK